MTPLPRTDYYALYQSAMLSLCLYVQVGLRISVTDLSRSDQLR